MLAFCFQSIVSCLCLFLEPEPRNFYLYSNWEEVDNIYHCWDSIVVGAHNTLWHNVSSPDVYVCFFGFWLFYKDSEVKKTWMPYSHRKNAVQKWVLCETRIVLFLAFLIRRHIIIPIEPVRIIGKFWKI